MVISKITTRCFHVSSNNSTNCDSEIGFNSTIEIDGHTNNHCFGKKFRIMSTIEQVCSVTGLLDKLSTTNNGAIVTYDMAMVDDNGTVFIALFVQGLKFTKIIN